jgi:hypothetical protein
MALDDASSQVIALTHFDGADGSTSFPDAAWSPMGWRVDAIASHVASNVCLSTTQSKFGGSSLKFTGSTGVLTSTIDGGEFGTGDFTIEFWVYMTAYGPANMRLVGYQNKSGSNSSVLLTKVTTAGKLETVYRDRSGSGISDTTGTITLTLNAWHHICIQRVSGTFFSHIDGVQDQAVTYAADLSTVNTTQPFALGGSISGTTVGEPFVGYIDELRITVGSARYGSGTWTPPSAAFQIDPMPVGFFKDTARSAVSLLLHCNEADGAVLLTDASPRPKTVTLAGTAKIVGNSNPFGGSSLRFDGTSGCCGTVADHVDFRLDGPFCIEFWAKFDDTTTNGGILHKGYYGTNGATWLTKGFSIRKIGSYIRFYSYPQGGLEYYSDIPIADLGWHHYAMATDGGTLVLFIDGAPYVNRSVIRYAEGDTGTLPLKIGQWNYLVSGTTDTSEWLKGNLFDIRITKGSWRYGVVPTALRNLYPVYPVPDIAAPAPSARYDGGLAGAAKNVLSQNAVLRLRSGIPSAAIRIYRGKAVISGTVKEKNTPANTPLRRQVVALIEPSMEIVGSTWSDMTTGAYTIGGLDPNYRYTLIAYDYAHNYRAVIADNMQAVTA